MVHEIESKFLKNLELNYYGSVTYSIDQDVYNATEEVPRRKFIVKYIYCKTGKLKKIRGGLSFKLRSWKSTKKKPNKEKKLIN